MIKLITLFVVAVAVADAGLLQAASPVISGQPLLARATEEYDPHPQYNFGYEVQDALSGDSKSQVEARDGDVVRGQYSLVDPDGLRRTVDYTADPINGFNAVVQREPLGYAAAAVKTVAAAPAVIRTAPIAGHGLIKSSALLGSGPLALPVLNAAPDALHSAHLGLPTTGIAVPAFLRSPQFATAAAGSAYINAGPLAGLATPSAHTYGTAGPYQSSLGSAGSFVKTTYASPYASYAW